MDTDLKRKMVSLEQLNSLLEFMKEHTDLAKGLSRGRRGKLMTLKVWNSCAKTLNAVKQGAVKDGKGWSKYWCDWKYRVRRHALELRAAKDSDRPPPDGLTPLSSIEETIMGIIGENAIDGVLIKTDPLADEDFSEDMPDNSEHDNEIPTSQYYATRSKKRKRRRDSSRDMVCLDENDAASSPPESKARLVGGAESEDEDESKQFLRLEREKLENSRKLNESAQTIASELTRLTDVLSQIKDFLFNKFNTETKNKMY